MYKFRLILLSVILLASNPVFAETRFEENFNSYSLGTNPNEQNGGVWVVFGSECIDKTVQGIIVNGPAETNNNWLRIDFNSLKGYVPTISFGIAPPSGFQWEPNRDFTNCVLSFDIRSNLTTIKPQVISIEIFAPVKDLSGKPIYEEDGVTPLLSTFRLLDTSLKSIPNYKQGWVTVSCNASSLRDPARYWARPILTQVKWLKIIFYQSVYDIVGKGYVEIDNIKAATN